MTDPKEVLEELVEELGLTNINPSERITKCEGLSTENYVLIYKVTSIICSYYKRDKAKEVEIIKNVLLEFISDIIEHEKIMAITRHESK